MRIVAGRWRGRRLIAPPGAATRPTADRVRQALFDMLMHAHWAGRDVIEGAVVLDAFAGSGALGLEALSRGAGFAVFLDNATTAQAAVRANIRTCGVEAESLVLQVDATKPPGLRAGVRPSVLAFLDPPYHQGLVGRSLAALIAAGWIAPGALIVAETSREEEPPHPDPLAERSHGAARLTIWRATEPANLGGDARDPRSTG